MLKYCNSSTTPWNHAVTYYKTLDEVHRGANGKGGGGQQWGGGNGVMGGGGNIGGSTVGVSSTSKNRPSHHKYKSPKQFELKQSWKALIALNARWALPVYPVFQGEKSKASDEKSVERKIALEKDRQD